MLALAALFTFSRRSGPIRPCRRNRGWRRLEFVETLGGLYQQAHAASVAVDVYYQRFQYWITRRLGIGNKATPEELDRAVRERWGLQDEEFLGTLQEAAAARYQPDLPQQQALKIVQSLYSYAVKLKLFPAVKEKALMEAVPQLVDHLRQQTSKVVVGQEEFRDHCLVTLLCRGHALLEGVPGVAKTLLVKTLSRILGLEFQRVQCTSDLMPADIIGTNILNLATSTFTLHKGPIFTDLLLVDEVNRMPPRTQAALLECMEEYQVTIDGVRISCRRVQRICDAESGGV